MVKRISNSWLKLATQGILIIIGINKRFAISSWVLWETLYFFTLVITTIEISNTIILSKKDKHIISLILMFLKKSNKCFLLRQDLIKLKVKENRGKYSLSLNVFSEIYLKICKVCTFQIYYAFCFFFCRSSNSVEIRCAFRYSWVFNSLMGNEILRNQSK